VRRDWEHAGLEQHLGVHGFGPFCPRLAPRAFGLAVLKDKVAGLPGPGMDVRIELVPEIQPGSGGKYRMLRSLLGSPYD